MNFLHRTMFFCLIMFSYSTFAQKVVKTDTLSGTELTISMDQKLMYDLDKIEDNCNAVATNTPTTNTSTKNTSSETTKKKVFVADRELTNAEICRRNPRIAGFKIQIAVVKSNDEANEVKAYFRRRFPRLKVDTDASLRPNYKILAGSYFKKNSADSDLKSIRGEFKSAVTVPYNIFCVEGK